MRCKSLLLVLSLMLAQACSDGDDKESEFPPGTLGLSGSVSGLVGSVTVSVNGAQEVIEHNGRWTATTRVNENENYSVSFVDSGDLTCTINNHQGVATTDIIDLDINCDGTNPSAYSLNGLDFAVTEPSVVTFAFHLVDRFTNTAVNGLNTDNLSNYLTVTENDLPISASESFLEIAPFNDVNARYTTVFAIDISSSLSSRELQTITDAIKANLVDSTTGETRLAPNQYVSILTFDSNVNVVINDSQDTSLLFDALDSLAIGGNSTNLFGAIKQGVELWDNEISLHAVNYGNLILFTDGNDTSASVSQQQAMNASQDKDLFFITIGSETDTSVLSEMTSSNRIYGIDNFDVLAENLAAIYQQVRTFEEGLYLLSYASPKRAGEHKLSIKANDDYLCSTALTDDEISDLQNNGQIDTCHDQQTYEFNTNNFTDVSPELILSGANTTLAPSVTWHSHLRWSHQMAEFNWQVKVCAGSVSYQLSDDNSELTLERLDDQLGIALIRLEEQNTATSTESYMIMAPSEESLFSISGFANLAELCVTETLSP